MVLGSDDSSPFGASLAIFSGAMSFSPLREGMTPRYFFRFHFSESRGQKHVSKDWILGWILVYMIGVRVITSRFFSVTTGGVEPFDPHLCVYVYIYCTPLEV